MLKALLIALLEPTPALRDLEAEGDYTGRLALLEELKTLPFGRHPGLSLMKSRRAGSAAGIEEGERRGAERVPIATECLGAESSGGRSKRN